jgi:hypothetical protein
MKKIEKNGKNINFSSYVFGRKDRKWENKKLVYVSFVW